MIDKMKDIDYSNAKITNYYSKELSIKEKLMLIWDILSGNEDAIYLREVTKIEEKEIEPEKFLTEGDRVVYMDMGNVQGTVGRYLGTVVGMPFVVLRKIHATYYRPESYDKEVYVVVEDEKTHEQKVCYLNSVYKYAGPLENSEMPAATVI